MFEESKQETIHCIVISTYLVQSSIAKELYFRPIKSVELKRLNIRNIAINVNLLRAIIFEIFQVNPFTMGLYPFKGYIRGGKRQAYLIKGSWTNL